MFTKRPANAAMRIREMEQAFALLQTAAVKAKCALMAYKEHGVDPRYRSAFDESWNLMNETLGLYQRIIMLPKPSHYNRQNMGLRDE